MVFGRFSLFKCLDQKYVLGEIDHGLPWPFLNQAETSCDSSRAILLPAFPDFVLVYSMSRCFTKCPVFTVDRHFKHRRDKKYVTTKTWEKKKLAGYIGL